MSQLDELIAHLEAAEKAIHELAALVPEWQPIETAPKDGTKVLIFDGEEIFLASYKNYCGTMPTWQPEYAEVPMFEDDMPSHWMPLPAPPKIDT